MNIEEFVNDYLQEHRHDILLSPYNGLVDFAKAFKEQMLKEAVEGHVWSDYMENYFCCLQINLGPIKGNEEIHDGDKVRVIVLKKED